MTRANLNKGKKVLTSTKGQLFSKQNRRAINSPKKQTLDFLLFFFFLQEDRLSFCINLEVVNLEVEIQRLFFGRSYGSTILFRD